MYHYYTEAKVLYPPGPASQQSHGTHNPYQTTPGRRADTEAC